MITMDWDQAAMELTEARFKQLSSRVRRNVLMTVGRKAAGILLPAVKAEEKPRVTGTLQKSLAKKVKAYASKNTVFVAVGAKSKRIEVAVYKDYRTGAMRTWKQGQPRKGPKMVNPAKYAHLAGPNRKGAFIPRVRTKMKAQVFAAIGDAMRDEVMKR